MGRQLLAVVDVFAVGTVGDEHGGSGCIFGPVDVATNDAIAAFEWDADVLLEDVGEGGLVNGRDVSDFVGHPCC